MELLDIYDEAGNHLGVADRNVTHALGLWHKTVHCWVVLPDGRVVFQRRSKNKADNPDKLYNTISGHVRAGETVEEALKREAAEELGIALTAPEFLKKGLYHGVFKKKDGGIYNDNAVYEMYFFRHPGALTDFKFKDGEVDGVAAIDVGDFQRLAAGEMDSISAQEYDGKEIRDISVGAKDFVCVGDETLANKYAPWLGKIKELF